MKAFNHTSGKIIPLLLIILILMAAALGIGYYLSLVRFDQKFSDMKGKLDSFESKYEMMLSSLDSDVREIKAYLKEKEGKAADEAKQLRMMSVLLKAKGEIISSKLSLSAEKVEESLGHLDTSITVLREAYELADEQMKEKIEDIRLRLATVKGIIEVNAFKAQQELDKLWREVDTLTAR
jgi:hypothetical protein